jgi:two-component system nitrogen regulation sensor histidine kinase NtrY
MFSKKNTKAGFILALIALGLAFLLNYINSYSTAELSKTAEKNLRKKEETAMSKLSEVQQMLEKNSPDKLFELFDISIAELCSKENIALYVIENDSLKFWTTNRFPVDATDKQIDSDNGILHLRNGWYEYFTRSSAPIRYGRAGSQKKFKTLALILIKPEFDVQNNYLKNAFPAWLNLPSGTKLNYPVKNTEHAVNSINKKPLFEIAEGDEPTVKDQDLSFWSVVLFFVALALALFFVVKESLSRTISLKQFILGSVILFVVRWAMIFFNWPNLLYHTSLYDVGTYANSQSTFNYYLGDILLNTVLLFVWAFVLYKKIELKFSHKRFYIISLLALSFIMIFLAYELNVIIKSLIENSTISFEFLNFFNLNALSFLCLGIVFFYGCVLIILVEKWLNIYFDNDPEGKVGKRGLVFVGFFFIYAATYFVFLKHHFAIKESLWFLIFFSISFTVKRFNLNRSLLSIGFRVLLFSLITSWLFTRYNLVNEKRNLQDLSDKLLDRADPFLESEFEKADQKIKNDKVLAETIRQLPSGSAEMEQKIRQKYFNGYFEKYNIQLLLFDSLCLPNFKNSNPTYNNSDYFEDLIKDSTTIPSFSSEDLFFIEGHKANTLYIAKINFNKKDGAKASHVLYAMLEPKTSASIGSFPELLLPADRQKHNQYPYAIYKQNKLASNFGDFDYPLVFTSRQKIKEISKGFTHHFYEQSGGLVVITTRSKNFNYFFTTNSYYFLFYSVLGLFLFLGYYIVSDKVVLFFSLNRRIQLFIVSILFFALSAVGIFSVRLVVTKFEEDRLRQLTESTQRIHSELNSTLFSGSKLDPANKPYAESVLKKYASLFNSDISLYDNNGYLFSTSRQQLFDLGLSSTFINPLAVANFKAKQSSYFNTRDNIGSLNYLSLYNTVYNADGKFLGYLNLPYFARQSGLEKELSDYLTTLLNVYVVLFLVSLFTGLIITAYITKPLRIVQQQIAKISFNKKNEPIQWQTNDEIGALVAEYNQMLLKLEDSANLLARSERESAWREMAKQVAHEIKNPLTPMKLNLQYLQRVVGENNVDFKEKFNKVSRSIIEQIDTLAHIAGEFSNFAQMPRVVLQSLNLNEIIQSSVQTFKSENIKISFQTFSDPVLVTADKDQCLRVFNNLIKNAIQAIADDRKGEIEISVSDIQDSVMVSLKDNGTGIPESMKEKIFVPNFTTKTTGTGLGLAMVKNIVNSFNGEIWFESSENEGATFFLRFRKA